MSIAFGVVLFARPSVGAVTLALLFGLFSIIYGISQTVLGAQLRQTEHTTHKIMEQAAGAGSWPAHGSALGGE